MISRNLLKHNSRYFSVFKQWNFLRYTHNGVHGEWKPPENGFDTGIQVFNCVARKKVPLIFRNSNCVTWYTCGPTVYDSAHIGHASCYVKLDIIQRILRDYFNVNLVTAMNITDIDDKIINRSKNENCSWQNLTERYESEFWNDLDVLGIQRPDIVLRVTQFMPEVIEFIRKLIEMKSAYVADDGSVYFENKHTVGKLQSFGTDNRDSDKIKESLKVRKSVSDFALWKAAKPGEPFWEVPWQCKNPDVVTAGRPGWHTECSAMASKLFGSNIDIHAGGIDLRFPHHENEEAQCCVYHNTDYWVNYWLHVGHLVARDDIKMSKSLKNTVSIGELLSKFTRDQFRVACLLSDYRYPMEFHEENMNIACSVLKRFSSFLDDTKTFITTKELQTIKFDRNAIEQEINSCVEKIDRSLKDDFHTTQCLHHLTEFVSFVNKTIHSAMPDECSYIENKLNVDIIQAAQNIVIRYLRLFGCSDTLLAVSSNVKQSSSSEIDVNGLVNEIVAMRSNIRKTAIETKDDKLFEICNKLRTAFTNSGIDIKDHGSKGAPTTWSFNLNFNVDKCKKK